MCHINSIYKNEVSSNKSYDKSTWLYDSDTENILTNDKNLLLNYKEEEITLVCANGSPLTFEGHGEFHFYINDYKIILDRVLYSKNVTRNIISGPELSKTGIKTLSDISKENIPTLTILDKNYRRITTIYANKNNEILITAKHCWKIKNNIKKYIFNVNKLNNESKLI